MQTPEEKGMVLEQLTLEAASWELEKLVELKGQKLAMNLNGTPAAPVIVSVGPTFLELAEVVVLHVDCRDYASAEPGRRRQLRKSAIQQGGGPSPTTQFYNRSYVREIIPFYST